MSDYIPEEILIKIFLHLPPKHLIGLRCVCKPWYSLISSLEFISKHTQRNVTNPQDTKAIVRYYSKAQNSEVYSVHVGDEDFTRLHDIKIPYPFGGEVRYYYRIVGSYNGVLCLSDDLFGPLNCVMLWNPVIRRKVKLSLPPTTYNGVSPSSFALGFGFDAHSNDYKVVKMAYALNEDDGRVFTLDAEVYALSTRNWHKIDGGEIPQNCIVEYFWSQVFLEGSVHWIAYRWSEVAEAEDEVEIESLIMAFDVASEAFAEIRLPEPLRYEMPTELKVTSLERTLGVIHYHESFSVWVLKNYGGEEPLWSELYTVDIVGGVVEMVLGFRADDSVLFTSKDGRLNSYDPFTGDTADLGILGTKRSFYVGPYVESLELLREGTVAPERIEGDDDDDDDEVDEDLDEDVDESEFCMQASVSQYLAALLDWW